MARDRQKAKQRRARRAGAPGTGGPATPSQPQRGNVPPDWEHASGDQDRFEAELVAGAGPDAEADTAIDADGESVDDPELDRVALEHTGDLDDDGDVDDDDRALAAAAEARATGQGGGGGGAVTRAGRPGGASPGEPTRRGLGRFAGFLRASWAELQRVQWPDRRQVGQATAVVVGFVIVAGAYLGLADQVAQKLVDFIL
jgi:preprotein translocase SecE subunit